MQRLTCLALVAAAGFTIAARQANADLFVSQYNTTTILDINTTTGASSTFVTSISGAGGTAFDSSGHFYAADYSTNTIQKYSSTGMSLGTFASTNINTPYGIAFEASGNLLVANEAANTVTEYSTTGSFVKTFATGLSGPTGITIDSIGDVFVSNLNANTINEYNSAGTLLKTLAGNLNGPSQMVLDGSNNLYVTNELGHYITKFSSSGTNLGIFATGSGGNDYGLAYDPTTGNFFQSSYGSGTIEEFNSAGVSLGNLATGLAGPFFLTGTPSVPGTVPEPASLAMMAIGLIGAGLYARRRHKLAASA